MYSVSQCTNYIKMGLWLSKTYNEKNEFNVDDQMFENMLNLVKNEHVNIMDSIGLTYYQTRLLLAEAIKNNNKRICQFIMHDRSFCRLKVDINNFGRLVLTGEDVCIDLDEGHVVLLTKLEFLPRQNLIVKAAAYDARSSIIDALYKNGCKWGPNDLMKMIYADPENMTEKRVIHAIMSIKRLKIEFDKYLGIYAAQHHWFDLIDYCLTLDLKMHEKTFEIIKNHPRGLKLIENNHLDAVKIK